MSKKKNEDEKLTVSKVYETLKSKQFLRKMYWDVLSGIKDKPTFKQMRETIKEIMSNKLDSLETLSSNKSDSEMEKNIVNEICTLAITVDTVYSKILFMKLEKEFNTQILNIIKDLRNEGEIPDDVWAELEIADTTSDETLKETNSSSESKTETTVKSTPQPVKEEKQVTSLVEDKKLHKKKKNVTENEVQISPNRMETRNHAVQKNIESPFARSTSEENLLGTSKIKEEEIEVDVVNNSSDYSDSDSIKSDGHISLASVSSVHTSDLSSFDDEISVSSGDESTKKKISLKELVFHRVSGKLNGTRNKSPKSSQDSDETTDKTAESTTNEQLLTPSKRIRKPNSKYSSDTILCHSVKVKDRKKSNVSEKNADQTSNEASSPKRKRTSDTEVETPSKFQKADTVKKNNSTDEKNPRKKSESLELYKPVASVRPLTSRRTAPITLYSTAP